MILDSLQGLHLHRNGFLRLPHPLWFLRKGHCRPASMSPSMRPVEMQNFFSDA